MASGVSLKYGSLSVTGNFRDNNEDNCRIDAHGRYFLVADGMGGQSAGEKASELAVDLISQRLDRLEFHRDDPAKIPAAIDAAIAHANAEIMALGEIEPQFRNMGTTISFVVRVQDMLYVGGVGDSRVYLLRDGKLEQITKDHSLTQALLDAGTISEEEAATHRYKNVLYRYLGAKEGSAGAEAKRLQATPGDRLLLCSDGVTDGLPDTAIADLVRTVDDPQSAAEEIVDAALKGGSRDNITCVVLHVLGPG